MKTIEKRLTSKTPRFFKKLRTTGLVLAGVGGVIVTAPVALPAALLAAGGYLTVAGGIVTFLSQLTIKRDE